MERTVELMNTIRKPSSAVVGIGGSETSVHAAQWAVAEALSRDLPLRLVYVTKVSHPSTVDYELDVDHGKASLRAAQAAIQPFGAVKVETAIIAGPPDAALIAESEDAAMVCIGTVGIGRYARSILGSTASELAEKAHCPVAVIRPQPDDDSDPDSGWIVVAINEETDNKAVIGQAMEEAKLRHAPVIVVGERRAGRDIQEMLDREVNQLRLRHPDVHIHPITDQTDVASFLKHCDEQVQLAVIGRSQADQLAHIVGPFVHSALHHARVSALVVRN